MSTPAAPTPLIPRRLLFGNPDRTTPRISPDGRYISYLAPLDGVLNVWVGPTDSPGQARPVTHDTQRGIREYFWAYTSAHVLYLQDQAGDENWRIFSVDLQSGEIRDLTPLAGVQARVEEVSHRHPDEILVGLNDREPQLHDLYRVNIRTGERQLVLENPGFIGFETHHYEVRLAQAMTPDGGCQFLKPTRGGWELFLAIGSVDALTTGPAGFDETGRLLYLLDSRDRDTTALFSMDTAGGAKTLLADDPRADAGDVERHPVTKAIQAVSFNYDRKRWQVLDEAVAADFAALAKVAAGDFSIVDRTLDDQHWIVAYDLDNGPQRFYRYDRARRAATYLFTNRRALEDLPLASMTPVIIAARDGRPLVSYVTLPADAPGQTPNRPAAPLPTVLLVHGGPWARDEWGYDAWHQWLANRGYAVLSVNFRGSTGFGKAFVNAGDREWGGRMHTDLLDAVAWAVQEGIADRQRVAIMGGSYGGYATLWALTNSPDVFACGVDIVGPSNLLTLLESLPPYWTPMIELFAARVGDHRTDEGRDLLRRRSPLTYAEQIRRPLLIGQGANDPRVKQAESDQIVAAMRSRDIPVTYVLYPDEGHGFARPENSLSFNAIAEAFLAAHLAGRCEPVGADFEGSSVEVPVGREHIPGLADALPAR